MSEIEVRVEQATERAVLVTNLDTMQAAWLPLSLVEFDLTGMEGRTVLVVPDWLACERGLV